MKTFFWVPAILLLAQFVNAQVNNLIPQVFEPGVISKGDLTHLDFYISYNNNGVWSKAKKLPEPLNSDAIEWAPKVTWDGKLFYFSSTRNNWTATPLKPENIEQFNRRLESAGNSLADIYTVAFKSITDLRP